MDTKVTVDYRHDPTDLSPIYLAITTTRRPSKDGWRPALRDTVQGQRVVWARFPTAGRLVDVWVRDRDGDRKVAQAQV